MTVYKVGSIAPSAIYAGAAKAAAIYKGSTQIWANPVPMFDAVGVGYSTGSSTTAISTMTWSHTATAGAYVVADISFASTGQHITSITYDGVAMTLIGVQGTYNQTYSYAAKYGIASVPGGTKTVSVTISANAFMTGCSVSYTGISSVGAPVKTYGNSATMSSGLITCGANQIISCSMGGYTSRNMAAGPSGTLRYIGPYETSAGNGGLQIYDATTSTTFTGSILSTRWATVSAVLS